MMVLAWDLCNSLTWLRLCVRWWSIVAVVVIWNKCQAWRRLRFAAARFALMKGLLKVIVWVHCGAVDFSYGVRGWGSTPDSISNFMCFGFSAQWYNLYTDFDSFHFSNSRRDFEGVQGSLGIQCCILRVRCARFLQQISSSYWWEWSRILGVPVFRPKCTNQE